jgi:AbrB family looped-hinge helix DNA binding protein
MLKSKKYQFRGKRMKSVITSKYQTTIPKRVREQLKLSVNDALEWRVVKGQMVVYPLQKRFLLRRNSIHTGRGDIRKDIENARRERAEDHR